MMLSLREAIFLAIRENPNIQQQQLNYTLQKFNLVVAEWQFAPQYTFETSANFMKSRSSGMGTTISHEYNVQPSVSLLTPVGTQIELGSINAETGNYNPGLSLQVIQPLMRGFGKAIVEAALNNARDSEVIARLNIEGTLRSTVTAVIHAYLEVVMAEKKIIIDEDALKRAELSVQQTKLFIKAGHKAENEVVTVLANVASAQTQLETDKNNLTQSRYALLKAIGLNPNQAIYFSSLQIDSLTKKYFFLPLNEAKQRVLKNDIQYQTDQILLRGETTRSLITAEDNTRWQLNFTGKASTGNGAGGGQNAGVNSLMNGANQAQSISLDLQIPIDDKAAKQAVMGAKIALKEAEIALKQEKWDKETSAINGWNEVSSAKEALRFAEEAEKLQKKTYEIGYQKYLYGLIDSLELQSAQTQLILAQQTLLNARIVYLRSLVNLDLLIGNTLNTWGIEIRL